RNEEISTLINCFGKNYGLDFPMLAMDVALSPIRSQELDPMTTDGSPMIINMTPTAEQDGEEDAMKELDSDQQYEKPPPLHTGADWKIVLHLPEIETWLRMTSERVRDLTYSVQQDSDSKHVDVHLVQLKDICEDISDHVEQIHALLETEFSLKLLSYSVNVIVDIHTVQLLWHQLRVSVLVLRERILQGLQDANGNYTRQTDILQAFSEETKEDRLDSLTEVDDSGQLTIKCSQNYLSLDCGITAFELSDYSPSEDLLGALGDMTSSQTNAKPLESWNYSEMEKDFPELIKSVGLLAVATDSIVSKCNEAINVKETHLPLSTEQKGESKDSKTSPELSLFSPSGKSSLCTGSCTEDGILSADRKPVSSFEKHEYSPLHNLGAKSKQHPHCENSTPKRSIRDCFNYNEDSPTQPTLPKRDTCNQREPNGQSQSKNEQSSSPTHSQESASSTDSGPVISSSPVLPRNRSKKSYLSSPNYDNTNDKVVEAWYGSDEYLALPSHLKQTEVLALKLENLTKLLPQKPRGETIQNIDDWELSEMNSDSEMYPTYQIKRKHKKMGRVSPSSSSDIVSSLGDSIESGPLSDILSDEELCVPASCIKKYIEDKSGKPVVIESSEKNESSASNRSALIQQLMQDIQHQDNYETIWEKIEGFVSKLDEFIHWLNEAMETTENWTPPKAETDSLKLYLETHLSFKLNVDSHCALKEAVVEEGCQLLELIVSHKSEGLKDMLQMIANQWKELQRQIKRQHSWILRALDIIKAEILATDVSAEDEEGTGSPKAEVQLCYLEAQRDAVEQMSLKLYSEQYNSSSKRKEEFADMSKVHTVGSNGLLDFDSEYQELWDWLIDMESIVMDSHDLMMSEEQQQHLYKRYNVEMSIRHPKKMELLSKVEALKKSGVLLPNDLLEKVDSINEKWELLGKTLGEKIQDTMVGHSGSGPRDLLSPESGSLVKQLEVRIKELKGWLRDTELFIFNSCLRQENEGTMTAEKQLQYFKSLCCEIKQRRRGVASVLRLCQHLLDDQETCNLNADHQSMQLIIVNLERRWEAIVMQAVQWQTRLQKKLGKVPEPLNVIDPGLMDLNGPNEDALEWDETDISHKLISINEELNELDQEQKQDHPKQKSASEECGSNDLNQEERMNDHETPLYCSSITSPPSPHIYQVYSLHNVELSGKKHIPLLQKTSNFPSVTQSNILNKSLKDSPLSSTKSLPDLIGRTTLAKPFNYMYHSGNISRHSESESRIVSEGDTETSNNSEIFLLNDIEGTESNPEIGPLEVHMSDTVDVIKQKIKQEEEDHITLSNNCHSTSSACCASGKEGDLNGATQHTSDCLEEELQGKHDVFTFYDYSYLQGAKLKLPVMMKQSQTDKACTEGTLLHGFYFDKIPCKAEHQSAELHPDELMHELTLASVSRESDPTSCKSVESARKLTDIQNAKQVSPLSHSSSLESLSVAGDLFGSSIFKAGDGLQRSTSLESWLTSYKSNEDLFSHHGSGDISASSDSVGELSKRTLDLLNRLENIQSPLDQKIKRSISDITLQSSSQKMSLAGQLALDIASSINEDSAASLTELSSSEDLSLCSEDIVLHRNKVPDSNASFRKHLNRSVADESDVNVSMIVNVSCTSACTDDEDDSDLLSSSTLTLTEEELGIKDEDDDSSIATDEDIYEECNLISGLDYIKNELQTWIRPKFSLTREKRRCNLSDKIQCSKDVSSNETSKAIDTLSTETGLNGSVYKLPENNGNSKNLSDGHELEPKSQTKKDSSQAAKDQFVDDIENGNVENTPDSQKEELIRTSSAPKNLGLLDGKGPENESCICEAFTDSSDDSHMDGKETVQPSNISTSLLQECQNHLQSDDHCIAYTPTRKPCMEPVSEMRGIDTQDTSLLKYLPNDQQSRTSTIEKPTDCCAAFEPNEAQENTSARGSDSCCNCESVAFDKRNVDDCSVHSFVMEIIDMASTALKSKSQPECETATPTSLTQIKEKVMEHSHRPIQLRKGDFYSYLSLSSHDSDCGEVTKYIEEKSSTPVPLDFADERENIECFFEACPEEERVEQQPHFSYTPPEGSLASGKVLELLAEPKTSAKCSSFSFLSNDIDVNVPNPANRKESNNLKNITDDSLTLDSHNEGLDMNSLKFSTKQRSTGKSLGTAKSKGSIAASAKVSAIGFQLKPDHWKDKDIECNPPAHTHYLINRNLAAVQVQVHPVNPGMTSNAIASFTASRYTDSQDKFSFQM
ncbi:unnamed protein product, partial [Caretta caretta]